MPGQTISAWVILHLWTPRGSYQTKTGSCACAIRRKSPRHASCVLWAASCLPENADSLSKNRPRRCPWHQHCPAAVFSDPAGTLEFPAGMTPPGYVLPEIKFVPWGPCNWLVWNLLMPRLHELLFNIYSNSERNFLEIELLESLQLYSNKNFKIKRVPSKQSR